MANRLLLGEYYGRKRLRFSKPGFDVLDPALTDDQLVFDSAWSEILKPHAISWDSGGLVSFRQTYSNLYRNFCRISFPALPFVPLALAWVVDYIIPGYAKRYTPVAACPTNSYIDVTNAGWWGTVKMAPLKSFAYIVFDKPVDQYDSREADNGGTNSFLLGNHPTRGPGLYVSRNGTDVLTCGDDDLTLSTNKPSMQVIEAGSFYGTAVPDGSTGQYIMSGTFNTAQNHPDLPPILFRPTADAFGLPRNMQLSTTEFGWVNDNTVRYKFFGGAFSQDMHYSILGYDTGYPGGSSATSTPRVLLDTVRGLRISKKDVDVSFATDDQLLMRTDGGCLHIKTRKYFAGAYVGYSGNASTDTNIAAPPILIVACYNPEISQWFVYPTGADLNALRTDFQPSSGAASPTLGAVRPLTSNQLYYQFTNYSQARAFNVAIIEHS
ncbi:hypothetical protein V5F77_05040 [Xanthobacter sp. DSM 24535]|uniref:hypothetical protein n=1 Tax=Roseixanthobacter psychrophilus TaxID=3119917 RepID=UPI0037294020